MRSRKQRGSTTRRRSEVPIEVNPSPCECGDAACDSAVPWCKDCGGHYSHECHGCGDALIWNYEFDAGQCYRCQDGDDES
jgi:hypothetical protein